MKTLRDQEEVEEVELEETSKEEEPGEEDKSNVTTLMRKDIWQEIFLIRGDHGALTTEPMGMQLNIALN
jgi:hypothetical protein